MDGFGFEPAGGVYGDEGSETHGTGGPGPGGDPYGAAPDYGPSWGEGGGDMSFPGWSTVLSSSNPGAYLERSGLAFSPFWAQYAQEFTNAAERGGSISRGPYAGWEQPRFPARTAWAVPAFFVNPPQGYGRLSPLALSYLSQLFPGIRENPENYPQYQYGKEPRPTWYPTRDYDIGEGTRQGETALIRPLVPSQQIATELERMGLMPLFQQYLKMVGAGDLLSEAKSFWPTQPGPSRAANWRVPVQR